MKCPVCQVKLSTVSYEQQNIRQCNQCHGHLLKISRLKNIEKRRVVSRQELLTEVQETKNAPDTEGTLRCPSCLRNMEKKEKQLGLWKFETDRCDKCEFIWLDRGELAKMQLLFETSKQGEESVRFQERLSNMTAEEKAEYEARIAALPEENLALEILIGICTEAQFDRGYHRDLSSKSSHDSKRRLR